jgi:hypothetical protein
MIGDSLGLLRCKGEAPVKNLSSVNRRLRKILSPVLFRSLYINRPLSQLSSAPLAHEHASSLKIDMFGSMWWWCSGSYVSSTDALELFASTQRMSKLRRLEVLMMKRNLDVFVSAFEEVDDVQTFLLPGIETLIVTSAAAFLASHCPDLKRLIVEDAPSCMIETYIDIPTRLMPLHPKLVGTHLTQLMHFETSANWSAEEIAALVPSFPRLHYLHMRSDAFCYRASTATIMELLGHSLKQLRILKLNKVGSLPDMGYRALWKRSITACATETQRRVLWAQNEARRVEAENNVARLAFTRIETLHECWLGGERIARRAVGCEAIDSLSWVWQRNREDVDVCSQQSEWAAFRAEKEEAVICSEICT